MEPNHSEKVIREAEQNKARMFATPGNVALNWCQSSETIKSASVDENYLVIGAHVDALTQQKIVNHEYVDFAKLLPRNRIGKEEDHQMELVNRGAPPILFQFLTGNLQTYQVLQNGNKHSGFLVIFILGSIHTR